MPPTREKRKANSENAQQPEALTDASERRRAIGTPKRVQAPGSRVSVVGVPLEQGRWYMGDHWSSANVSYRCFITPNPYEHSDDPGKYICVICRETMVGDTEFRILPLELYNSVRADPDVKTAVLEELFAEPLESERSPSDTPPEHSQPNRGEIVARHQVQIAGGQKLTSALIMLQDASIITRGKVRYMPLPLAAWAGRASEATISKWVQKRKLFEGRRIDSYTSPKTGALYVSEESVDAIANRFIKWPSKQRAGLVTLGETADQSGFLGMSEAGRMLGVAKRTMWLWASQGKAPTDRPLDVIKCTISDYFYIRERDVIRLKDVIPRTGLHRGPRRLASLEHS